MTRHPVACIALAVALSLPAATAVAQAPETFVSTSGRDAGPCARAAPCRTFAGAIAKTAAGGRIVVLDSGSYGPATITRSLTIDGGGLVAGVFVDAATDGLIVDAGAAGEVRLRGLVLEGGGGGSNAGIRVLAGKAVSLEEVSIRGFERGVAFAGRGAAATRLSIVDSRFEENRTGVVLQPGGAATVSATITRVRMEANGAGVRAESGSTAAISASTISGGTHSGVNAVAAAGRAAARVTVTGSTVSGNAVGVKATRPAATVVVAASTVSGNRRGLQAAHGGRLLDGGGNRLRDNTGDGAFTGTTAP